MTSVTNNNPPGSNSSYITDSSHIDPSNNSGKPGPISGSGHFQTRAAVPPPGNNPQTPPPKPDTSRQDFLVALGGGRYGLFKWDPVKGDFVLKGTKQGKNGTLVPLTPAEDEKYNKYAGNAGVTVPEPADGKTPADDRVVFDKKGGDGPVWRLGKDGKMVQVGYRSDGKVQYFKPSTYAIVQAYNQENKITYMPNGELTEVPPKEDPEHPDIWVPPTGPDRQLYRWNPKAQTHLLTGKETGSTYASLDLATYKSVNQDAFNLKPIPERHPEWKADWVRTPDDQPNGDGPIYRMTASGKVIQIGERKNGEIIRYSSQTVNLIDSQNPKGGPVPSAESQMEINAKPIPQLTGAPPETGSTDPKLIDREVKMNDGKYGVMRWEPNVKRYVLIGTRPTPGGEFTKFSDEDYHKFNNGPAKPYSHTDTPDNLDYADANGVIWRYDPKLKREVQVGWQDANKEDQYFSANKTEKNEFRNDMTQSAIDSYNMANNNAEHPMPVADANNHLRNNKQLETWPSVNDPKHPDLVLGAADDPDGKKYVWRWHPGLNRYVAIKGEKDDKDWDKQTYLNKNRRPDGLHMTADDAAPPDVASIPTVNDPNHPDIWRPAVNDPSGKEYMWRWHPGAGRYVAIRDTKDGENFDYKTYLEKNVRPGGIQLAADDKPPQVVTIPDREDPDHKDKKETVTAGRGAAAAYTVVSRWDPSLERYVKIGWYRGADAMTYYTEWEYKEKNGL